jgi:hypothetical protein
MDFKKQYIVQAISVASNNLRLSSDKIETVAILKEHFEKCNELENEIQKMKTKTELSKFAIKLWESYQFVSTSHIDFLKISDLFKNHSHNLVMELSNLLDVISPEKLSEIFASIEGEREIAITLGDGKSKVEIPTNIEYNKIEAIEEDSTKEIVERDELKEELILGEIESSNNFDFDDFEEEVLKPIGKLEVLLKNILSEGVDRINLTPFILLMQKNATLSREIGFSILAEMHTIIYSALTLMEKHKLESDKNLIESLRACLIVIVAVVRGKDVDITNYLNRAENLGKYLKLD